MASRDEAEHAARKLQAMIGSKLCIQQIRVRSSKKKEWTVIVELNRQPPPDLIPQTVNGVEVRASRLPESSTRSSGVSLA